MKYALDFGVVQRACPPNDKPTLDDLDSGSGFDMCRRQICGRPAFSLYHPCLLFDGRRNDRVFSGADPDDFLSLQITCEADRSGEQIVLMIGSITP